MQTPEQQAFYGNIRQQSGVECKQMKKTHFPSCAKCCQLVTFLMRLKWTLKDHGGATTAMAMLWVMTQAHGLPDSNPIPSQTSFLGPGSIFNLQDFASTSLGPYLHIFQELCWLPIPPHALGPAQTMLQPRRGFGKCQPLRSELGLSPARTPPANELHHINTSISFW